jgi:hypothetical protein
MDRGEDSGVMRRADVLLEAQIEADESSSIEESTPEVAAPVLARAQLALGNRGLLAAISGNASTPWLRQWRNAVMFERAGVSADNLLTNAAMLAMMRHTQEEEQEAFKLPASAGDKLPDVLRAKFEAAFGHDFSHVRVHTTSSAAKASKDLHAHAFAVGSDIYFGPGEWAPGTRSGDKLLAHELTHVVQHDEGRLPTGGGVSSPTDPAEVEAYSQEQRMADAVHVMPEAGPAQHDTTESTTSVASSPMSPILREAEATGEATGETLPEEITLTLGGVTLNIPLTGSENPKSITVDSPPCSIRGLTITQVEVELEDDMTVARGVLHSEMIVNEHMKIENLALEISANGEVNANVPETPFKISENFQGMIALNFNEEGVSGEGKLTFEQIPLREHFSLTGGEITVSFDAEGAFNITGEVTGVLQEIGELSLKVTFLEGLLGGELTVTPYVPLQIIEGVVVDSGTIGGVYNETEQLELFGELGLVVGEWATGTARVDWNTQTNTWKFDAELLQAQEFLLNEIAITDGRLHATMEEGVLTVAEANTNFIYKEFSGTIQGNMDLPAFTLSGTATAILDTPQKLLFGEAGGAYSLWLTEGNSMTVVIVENKLTEISGVLPFQVQDAEGPLIDGSIEGTYDIATEMFNGTGEVYLGRDLHFELGGATSFDLKKESGGKGTIENSELRSLEGTLMCVLSTGDEPLAELTATGEYDVVSATLIQAEGTATILRPFELLDGLVILDGIEGTGKMEENKLVSLGGVGTISIPTMNEMTGTFEVDWRNDGGKDIYTGSGELAFTLLDDPTTGRKTAGTVGVSYSEDDKLGIEGNIEYQMNDMIGGEVGVSMDIGPGMPLDPILSGVLSVNTTLVKGKDLFSMEIPLLPEIAVQVGGPFPIVLNIGAAAGMKVIMDPLTMQASIGVENFRPLTDNSEVPTFTAELDLNWGMTFNAMAAAWMELGLGYGPVSAGAGVRGQVDLDAPLTVSPYGLLTGGPDGFSGELGIGIGLSASVSLSIIPYVYAQIASLAAEYDFPGLEIELGELFSFEWGTKYLFGDKEGTEPHSPEAVAAPAPTNSDTKNEKAVAPPDTSASEANNIEGGPQLESGSDIAAQQSGAESGGGKMDEFKEKADQIKTLAAGIGAIAFLVTLVVSIITAFATFGPIGLVVYLVYEMVFGNLSWDNIENAVNSLTEMVTTGREMLEPFLPDWWKKIEDVFTGEKPSLWDALFGGADDAMRASVRAGDHRHAPPEMRRRMVTDMLDGWTGEADQECILEVLEFSNSNGDIRGVINSSDLADWVLSDLDGAEDDGARSIFESNGIDW